MHVQKQWNIQKHGTHPSFVGLALVGKDIVFRFIIEYIYSSLRDFYGPLGDNRFYFLYEFFFRKIAFWVVSTYIISLGGRPLGVEVQ